MEIIEDENNRRSGRRLEDYRGNIRGILGKEYVKKRREHEGCLLMYITICVRDIVPKGIGC